jgi:hypothetical protein
VAGNNDTILGNVNGVLIVTGSNDVIGSKNRPISLNDGLILVGDDDTVYARVNGVLESSNGSPTVLSLGTGETITGTVNGNIDEYGNGLTVNGTVNGTTSAITTNETYTISTQCLGTVSLSVSQPSPGSTSSLANISIVFSSGSIEG